MHVAERETAKPLSFVRRFLMEDGTYRTNPGRKNKDKVVRPASDADNTVRLVRFRREGAKDIALVNFSTHPDVIGGELYSADWPGFVRRYVEADLANVSCLLVNGAQGDTNHIDLFGDGSTKGYEHSAYMGRMIADTVLAMFDQTRPCHTDGVFAKVDTVYVKSNTEGEERYEECVAQKKAYERGELPHLTMEQLAETRRISNLRALPLYHPVVITVLSLGELALVGFGGEPFTDYANRARAALPHKFTVAACCANGYAGYLPTGLAFQQGGYEAKNSPFVPELEELVMGKTLEILKEL